MTTAMDVSRRIQFGSVNDCLAWCHSRPSQFGALIDYLVEMRSDGRFTERQIDDVCAAVSANLHSSYVKPRETWPRVRGWG